MTFVSLVIMTNWISALIFFSKPKTQVRQSFSSLLNTLQKHFIPTPLCIFLAELYEIVLDRLEADYDTKNKDIVPHFMGYLAASRRGNRMNSICSSSHLTLQTIT
jgi:hypothetical protein